MFRGDRLLSKNGANTCLDSVRSASLVGAEYGSVSGPRLKEASEDRRGHPGVKIRHNATIVARRPLQIHVAKGVFSEEARRIFKSPAFAAPSIQQQHYSPF
jgi:hypothetical protein